MINKNKKDLEEFMNQIHICIESSHNEQVQIEAVQYNEFLDKLVEMNFKIGVIKKAPLTNEKISDYNVIIIGTPKNSSFSKEEIEAIQTFVYNGGGLFLLSDQGGDATNNNNLSELASLFGMKFSPNLLLNRRAESEEDEQLIPTNDFYNHFIMRGIEKIALKSPCSLELVKAKDVEINAVAFSPIYTDDVRWDGTQWVEGRQKKHILVAVAKYGAGKVVGLGTTRILSTLLNKKHGYNAEDNEKLVNNILAWLVNREIYEDGKLKSVFMNISIKPDLYFWIEKELKNNDSFRDFTEVVNFSIESLKRGIEKYRSQKQE